MLSSIHKTLIQSLNEVESFYHRLILLVGQIGSGKTNILRDLSKELELPIINLNLQLSEAMLEMTNNQRALHLPKLLNDIINTSSKTVILDNIEIIFDAELKQDPLRLLQSISRNKTLLVSWNGEIKGKKLIYSEQGHPEYREYDIKDLIIISLENFNSFSNK